MKKNKRKEASVVTAVMNTNLTICMGQMQELNKPLNFLDCICLVIGDEDYAARTKKLMPSSLPDPEMYRTEIVSTKTATIKSKPEEEKGNAHDKDDELYSLIKSIQYHMYSRSTIV